ncbi:hypothetical protein [Cupriavidus basilensis]
MSQQTEARELAPAAIDRKVAIEAAAKAARHAYWRPGFPHDDWERAPDITKQKWIDVANAALRAAPPAPVGGVEPDWRELLRRCYVELFHCDQQMASVDDEEGNPYFTQGATVRDILRDAKSALESHPILAVHLNLRAKEHATLGIPAGWCIDRLSGGQIVVDPPKPGEEGRVVDLSSKSHGDRILFCLADALLSAQSAPLDEGGSEPVGYFMKSSSFGPWIEVENAGEGAQPLYAAPAPSARDEKVTRLEAMVDELKTRLHNAVHAAPQPSTKALKDEQIVALAKEHGGIGEPGDRWDNGFSHAGLLDFARALLAAEQPSNEQADEDAYVIDRLSKLLAGVAIALKGDEQPLMRHSYHDLPDLAAALQLELDLYRANAEQPSEDKRDAERYRWLRDSERLPDEIDGEIIVGMAGAEDLLLDDQLDRAIDAAIAKGEGK